MRGADFNRANLAGADFYKAEITDSQLQSAVSIQNARLPNGSLAHDPNLLANGYADCDTPVQNSWQVLEGVVVTIKSETDQSGCYFVSRSANTKAIMTQYINLTDIWDSSVWTESKAVLQGWVTVGVSIQMNAKGDNDTVLGHALLSEMN